MRVDKKPPVANGCGRNIWLPVGNRSRGIAFPHTSLGSLLENIVGLLHYLNRKDALTVHGEIAVDNFTMQDPDLAFFSLIRAACLRKQVNDILDYGAGRNYYTQDFKPEVASYLIRELRDLRVGGARVTAVDVSEAVLTNPTSDMQLQIVPNAPLPFDDNSFDMVVSDFVFEHLENPGHITAELLRVVRPGGWIFIRTPNKWGYVAWIASLVPNNLHQRVLKFIQPYRKDLDVFPVYYRINTQRAVRSFFSDCDVTVISDNWEPQYFYGRLWLYRINRFINNLLPKRLGVTSIYLVKTPE